MNTHNEEKPNKDEDYSKILGLSGKFLNYCLSTKTNFVFL